MEEWKSDVWKAEWEASRPPAERISPSDQTVILLEGRPVSSSSQDSTPDTGEAEAMVHDTRTIIIESHEGLFEDQSGVNESPNMVSEVPAGTTPSNQSVERFNEPPAARITGEVNASQPSQSPESQYEEVVSAAEAELLRSPQSTEADQSRKTKGDSPAQITSTNILTTATSATPVISTSISPSPAGAAINNSTRQRTITQTVSTTIILSAATPSPSSPVPNGESVYRMIINRLTVLEGNQTLYAKYVEEQGRMVNIRLERMEEDIGRLGGIVSLYTHRPSLD